MRSSTQATLHVTPRSRRDLATNPAFDELLLELENLVTSETERLALDAREPDITRINWQSGALEGSKRSLERLLKYRTAAIDGFKQEEKKMGEGSHV